MVLWAENTRLGWLGQSMAAVKGFCSLILWLDRALHRRALGTAVSFFVLLATAVMTSWLTDTTDQWQMFGRLTIDWFDWTNTPIPNWAVRMCMPTCIRFGCADHCDGFTRLIWWCHSSSHACQFSATIVFVQFCNKDQSVLVSRTSAVSTVFVFCIVRCSSLPRCHLQ